MLFIVNLLVLLVWTYQLIKIERKTMATIAEIQASIATIGENVATVDVRLDEVAARISTLEAGQVVTPEQLADILTSLESVKTASAAVVSEVSGLTTPVVVEPPPVEEEPIPAPIEE